MTGLDRSPAGRAAARRALGLPDEALVVAASGGSLGSRRINAAVLGVAGRWAGRPGVAIYHVVGERDHRDMAAAAPAPAPGGLVYRQVPFEQRMDLVLTAADVVVGRAGAGTVFELAAAGVASVLVPLPGAPGDHQSANAARMAEAGAAVVVADAELDTDRLESVLADLLGDPRRRAAMGEAATAVARPDAAAAVAALVEANARG
jgi:UDP-N-acetylglucosamine--N-acetylmuramyl-(pentapeptide) pyrophosphoryl-undecaprenol N-acetylglucosamine transferase